MSRRTTWTLTLALAVTLPAASLACLWDYDTLEMERQDFPQIAELISGKFLRHSKAFYEWRIKNRQARLEATPNDVALYDDLAVAYDKTGQHEKAIETILKVQEIKPDRYETLANLGTFHIHNGDLETGLGFIEKAIEVNPEAHFGREIYQKLLVKYVLEKRGDGPLPQPMSDEGTMYGRRGFARFVMLKLTGEVEGVDKGGEIEKAVKGVSGMMHFGHHDSPVLLEALADLLMAKSGQEARHLAARAWLKASYETKNEDASAAYRKFADQVLSLQTPGRGTHSRIPLLEFEQQFQQELAAAEEIFSDIVANESRWIEEGADVDRKFWQAYGVLPEEWADKQSSVKDQHFPSTFGEWFWNTGRFWLPVVILFAILIVWLRNTRRRRNTAEVPGE
ncbi:MAG: hypothetical protein H8E37_04750 [Planctomycetes bacterium]|nr:hypothetical protein [Planctomycetota bacterium]